MQEKKLWMILTFATTAAAIGMEKFCQEENLPGRLIPLPAAIEAGCGLAWKAPAEEEDRIMEKVDAANINWDALYEMEF